MICCRSVGINESAVGVSREVVDRAAGSSVSIVTAGSVIESSSGISVESNRRAGAVIRLYDFQNIVVQQIPYNVVVYRVSFIGEYSVGNRTGIDIYGNRNVG